MQSVFTRFAVVCAVAVTALVLLSAHHHSAHSLRTKAVTGQVCPDSATFVVDQSNRQLNDTQAQTYMNYYITECPTWKDVTNLTLLFSNNKIESIFPFTDALQELDGLEVITLNLSQNKITDAGLGFLRDLFDSQGYLEEIYLNFDSNAIESTKFFSLAFRSNTRAKTISLSLQNNKLLTIDGFQDAFSKNLKLSTLSLNFEKNNIFNISALATTFSGLRLLQTLTLNFNRNQLSNVQSFNKTFYDNRDLQYVTLQFQYNVLSDIKPVGLCLTNNLNVDTFNLDLSHNQLEDIEEFKNIVQTQFYLTQLNVDASYNNVRSTAPLLTAFQNLDYLKGIKLLLNNNHIETGITEMCDGLVTYVGQQQKAFFPFYVNLQNNYIAPGSDEYNTLQSVKTQLQEMADQIPGSDFVFKF